MRITVSPRSVRQYYDSLEDLRARGIVNEMGLRQAFQRLLEDCIPQGWRLVPEHALANGARPDATLFDENHVRRGYWEAKDSRDDLETEIHRKLDRGYPRENTVFEDGGRAVLYQNSQRVHDFDLTQRRELTDLLQRFLGHEAPESAAFNDAGTRFRAELPDMALDLRGVIDRERGENRAFTAAFEGFHDLCRGSIDPAITVEEIEEMLVQHLLTERLFRNVFDNAEFTRRNAIAAEVERVIDALTSRQWNRDAFLRQHDLFYAEIEARAREITAWSEKQAFLNSVYERFFQGFSRRQADTHGIVYTPQAIVDFMCASVDAVLQETFGKSLSSPGVRILDPCTGTGNFIVNLLNRIEPRHLERKYREELFANEIMLLPYYIAALNIEHRYFELTGRYEPFEGLCFTDTLDLAEVHQEEDGQITLPMSFAPANTERVQREQDAEITVIIGNPPYNVGQQNENDNNKNRRYPVVDRRIRETYGKESRATSKVALNDAYVRFFRWATDRLGGRDGIICFVSNNSFVNQLAFDGMREHLTRDFHLLYHMDLHGNVRKNPKLSGTTHNVFGIQVGVGITFAVRKRALGAPTIGYHRVPEGWRREEKLQFLARQGDVTQVEWVPLHRSTHGRWAAGESNGDYAALLPLGSKAAKAGADDAVFTIYSRGSETCRDSWMYAFSAPSVRDKARSMIEVYNAEVSRWSRQGCPEDVDAFVLSDETRIKWCSRLKECLTRGMQATYEDAHVRRAHYRPFSHCHLYFDPIMTHRRGLMSRAFPTDVAEAENTIVIVGGYDRKAFSVLLSDRISDVNFFADPAQCFPLYVYDEDGSNRRENVTEWALGKFREAYGPEASRRDIFYYVYAVLHHPVYRERYAENLKRELPRIPLAPSAAFRGFVQAGERLAGLHLKYEEIEPYPLEFLQNRDVPVSWRVTKMRLAPDKASLVVNEWLTLAGIPPECFEYRLGNRSALEWVIDQYQVRTDRRSGITSDPNRPDDPEYIVRLVGQVIRVSLETQRIIAGLPGLDGDPEGSGL